ncbi:tigger transposable element-derived protein 6-like [Rhizophagus irregularis DAOM 181602=DAOM 197198]|nr:tigger transposable element-derived protein 6-like [Rhizophagus irregularis DAOM 181602=DAOM 197198]
MPKETPRKRKSFTSAQKKEICLKKISTPFLKQKDLAKEYDVSEGIRDDSNGDNDSYQANLKREKKIQFPIIEEAWIDKALQAGLVLTESILATKALDFALLCNEKKFKASNGAPIQDLDSMREKLRQTLRDYDPKEIFNCDETDSHIRVQNRHILLLVNNAPTHALSENTTLTNIVIEYLLPNTTSHLQSCDQGIINSFKAQYRKLYLRNWVKAFDNFNEHGTELDEIDIKKCIKYIARAWNNVTNDTIKNCWLKAGIIPEYGEPSDDESVNREAYENNADIQLELERLRELEEVQVLINKLGFENSFTAEKFVLYDDFEVTTEMISDYEILKAVQPNNQEKEEIEEEPLSTITHNEVIKCYDKVILYLQCQEKNYGSNDEDINIFRSSKMTATAKSFKINIYSRFNKSFADENIID